MKNRIQLSPEREAAMRRMWPDAAITLRQIIEMLGHDDATVHRLANRLNLGPRPDANVWTEQFTAMIARRYAAGEGCAALAREFRLTRNMVTSKLQRLGLIRPREHGAAKPAARVPRAPKPAVRVIANKQTFAEPEPRAPIIEIKGSVYAPLPDTSPVIWTSRAWNGCSWPVGGEGADTLSCGLTVHKRGWCSTHYARGSQKPPPRKALDPLRARQTARFG
jgi:hypothetical protein